MAQRVTSSTALFYLRPCFVSYNNYLMHSKASLAVIFIAMLLTQSLHGAKWQGTGSGMNSTVIAEIWNGLETKVDTAVISNSDSTRNALVKEISDRLNAQWSQAWNVVMTLHSDSFDTILYAYAFRNQWMWYNNVPYASKQSFFSGANLLVWKDYNCQDWKTIGDGVSETSSFTTAQKNAIRTEIGKMTEAGINNDIWGTAYNMMKNLGENPLFSSGAFSVIMGQYGFGYIYGRICRVGDGFYNSYTELGGPILGFETRGKFYLFQNR